MSTALSEKYLGAVRCVHHRALCTDHLTTHGSFSLNLTETVRLGMIKSSSLLGGSGRLRCDQSHLLALLSQNG